MNALLAIELPNPLGPIANGVRDALGAGARQAGGVVLGPIGDGIVRGLAGACKKVAEELLHFLSASASVSFERGWWASPRGQAIVHTVGALAVAFMVGFLLLAIIQGLLVGEPGTMVRAALVEVPVSVIATVVLVAVAQLLLGVTDEASTMVLDRAPEDLARFLAGFGNVANVASSGFAGVIMLVLFLVGALLVWIELVVRSSLIYWLAAAAPLIAAARVWPAARGAFRKLCEIGLALILSKFAIALALGLGAAALAGGGPKSGDLGTRVGLDLAGLLGGAALMLLAAFTPFVLLRLLPILEVAVVAQGISHSPARAAQTGLQAGYYMQGLERMASAGHRQGPASGAARPLPEPGGAGPGSGPTGSGPSRPGGPQRGSAGTGAAGALPVGAASAATQSAALAASRTTTRTFREAPGLVEGAAPEGASR